MSPGLPPCPCPTPLRRRRPRAARPFRARARTGWRLPSPGRHRHRQPLRARPNRAALVRTAAPARQPTQDPACQLQERVRAYFDDPGPAKRRQRLTRQQRSERREACLDLLGALVHYLDLATLRVGIPQADGSIQGLSLAFLAEKPVSADAGRAGLPRSTQGWAGQHPPRAQRPRTATIGANRPFAAYPKPCSKSLTGQMAPA